MSEEVKPIPRVTYGCPYCNTFYDTQDEALECIEKGEPVKLEVGDIVSPHDGHGWFDGNPDWVVNQELLDSDRTAKVGRPRPCPDTGSTNCFRPCCTLGFYYVVVEVARWPRCNTKPTIHDVDHTLVTDAMTGKNGHRVKKRSGGGLTKLGDPPPEIVMRAEEIVKEWEEEHGQD
jgi:hypothetical protein